jgi:hypothetical protein
MASAGKPGLVSSSPSLRRKSPLLHEEAAEVRARKFEFPGLGSYAARQFTRG